MNKRIYLSAIAIGIIALLLLFRSHSRFSHAPVKMSAAAQPPPPVTTRIPVRMQPDKPAVAIAIDDVVKNNIFHPERGKASDAETESPSLPPAGPRQPHPRFELSGVFTFAETTGAIIVVQGAQSRNKADEPMKRWFILDEHVADGFILKTITGEQVVLQRDQEKVELGLKKYDQTAPVAAHPAGQPVIQPAHPAPVTQNVSPPTRVPPTRPRRINNRRTVR